MDLVQIKAFLNNVYGSILKEESLPDWVCDDVTQIKDMNIRSDGETAYSWGISSIEFIELIIAIEENYGIEITGDDVINITDVKSLIDIILERSCIDV